MKNAKPSTQPHVSLASAPPPAARAGARAGAHAGARAASRILALALVAAPGLALAHAGVDGGHHHGAIDAFLAGVAHPFTGLDHLLAMLGVGLWSANFARRAVAVPIAFMAALLLGALAAPALLASAAAGSGAGFAAVEPLVAASVLVIGLVGAAALRLPGAVGIALVGLFALMHGAAHGRELAGGSAVALAGMLVASAALHACGWWLGRAMPARSAWASRAAGAAMAAAGAAMLAGIGLAA